MLRGDRWEECALFWLGVSVGRGNLIWVFARTVAVLLVPFCFPDKMMDLSCNNAIFTFGLFWTFGDLCSCNLPQKRNDNKTADLNGEY